MKKTKILIPIFVALLLISIPMLNPVKAAPRSDLDIVWYESNDAAYTAMVNSEVDLVQWSLTYEQWLATEANPNLQIGQYVEQGMFEFDLNNNDTIVTYPGMTNPMHIEKARHAIEHLIDKDYIISAILQYFGSRVDAPVAYPNTEGWVDLSVVTYDQNHDGIIQPNEDNYPYPYDVDAAAALLASCSFGDTDGNGYLNYPDDPVVWGAAAGLDTTVMPLVICIRADHTHRREAGRYLYRQLEGDPAVAGDSVLAASAAWAQYGKIGGDWDTTDEMWVVDRAVLSPKVMRDRDYHIYTGGWSFGRYPTHLFFLFHSMFWYPYGPNYVTAYAHPDEDLLLEDIYYTDSIASAQVASIAYTHEHVVHCKNIPLWSYTSYVAWKKTVAGVVNMKGYGIVNDYTFYNAYRTDVPGAPVRAAAVSSWDRLNVLYSQWYFEYLLLDRVTTGTIGANPYDLGVDIPFAAQDWEAGTWIDDRDGLEKSVVTFWFRKDVGSVEPDTGCASENFKYDDYEFTVWYNYAFDDSWAWSNFMDVHHLERVDDYTVRVYFDDLSYWFQYAAGYPLLGPKSIMKDLLMEEVSAVDFTGADLVNDFWDPTYYEYQFTTDQVVQVTVATCNGVPMVEGEDYYIRAGYDVFCHNVFVNLTSFAPGDVIHIGYYRPIPLSAGGTYLGGNIGLDWTDTMYSYGMFYPVSISSTSAALNKNPAFFWETPLLGEIDWRWEWVAGPKPRKGSFHVGILDVVRCTAAYCSRGDGVYDPLYIAGADIDGSDLCHIGILDLVTITGKYCQRFGTPVDSPLVYCIVNPPLFPHDCVLPDYHDQFTVLGENAITWTFSSETGTITITSGTARGFIYGKYHKADCTWDKFLCTIDP